MIFLFKLCFAFHFRCLKGEGEIEKLGNQSTRIAKKSWIITAAVQELGRENQSLQVSHLLI